MRRIAILLWVARRIGIPASKITMSAGNGPTIYFTGWQTQEPKK